MLAHFTQVCLIRTKEYCSFLSPSSDRTLHPGRMRSCSPVDVLSPFIFYLQSPACIPNRFIMKDAASCWSVHVDLLLCEPVTQSMSHKCYWFSISPLNRRANGHWYLWEVQTTKFESCACNFPFSVLHFGFIHTDVYSPCEATEHPVVIHLVIYFSCPLFFLAQSSLPDHCLDWPTRCDTNCKITNSF